MGKARARRSPPVFQNPADTGAMRRKTMRGGSRYVGEVGTDGEPHGRGACTWPDGARYEGRWRDGKPHGQGVMTFSNGGRYEGEFRDGKPHGRGIVTVADGARYEGVFRDGYAVQADG